MKPLTHIPSLDRYFIFKHPKKKTLFRAQRLESNHAYYKNCKVVLFDTGEIIYQDFSHEYFFDMPEELCRKIPHVNRICLIDKFPDLGKKCARWDFIKAVTEEYMLKFTVKSVEVDKYFPLYFWYQDLITVDVEFAHQKDYDSVREKFSKIPLTKAHLEQYLRDLEPPSELIYLRTAMFNDLIPKDTVPSKGDKVYIYPVQFIKTNYIYGHVQLIRRKWISNGKPVVPDEVVTAYDIRNKMNDRRLQFRKFSTPPIKNQVVIASRYEVS